MTETPVSLLHRLCRGAEVQDWERFVRLFTPLLWQWTKRLGVPPSDAEDVLQEVFTVLVRKLPDFQYDAARSFRAYLWTVVHHAAGPWRDRGRRQVTDPVLLDQLASPPVLDEAVEAEYNQHLLDRILQLVRTDFDEQTWHIFQRTALDGRPGKDVAREMAVSVNTVYLARSRVLARLREELAGWDS